jgi:hypothetical protein
MIASNAVHKNYCIALNAAIQGNYDKITFIRRYLGQTHRLPQAHNDKLIAVIFDIRAFRIVRQTASDKMIARRREYRHVNNIIALLQCS